jgi:hypothetical protein
MHVAVHVIAVLGFVIAAAGPGFSQVVGTPPRVEVPVTTPVEIPNAGGITSAPQAPAQGVAGAEDRERDVWSFAAELSFTDQSGNKTLRLLTGGLKFSHQEKQNFELNGALQSRYGQSDGEVVARNYFATFNFSPHTVARLTPSFSVKAERDPFKRLDVRFVSSAGAKLTPYRAEKGAGEMSLLLMSSYEFQNLKIQPSDSSDEFTHVPRWTMEMRGSQKLNQSVTAHVQSSYEPSWGELANYLLRSETGMKVLLTERLALSVEYHFNRTNQPPEGVAPEDRLFKTGIIIDF